jgi:hypothetical protein
MGCILAFTHQEYSMRACLRSLWIVMFALGCTGHPEVREADQGVAELRIDASPLLASNVTRVTVETAGQTADLVSNAMTGTFDGTLLVPAGSHSFVARAFSDQTLVGQSAPTPAVVQVGAVTRVVIRILDITPDAPPVFGPIFDSLTYPTTVTAGAQASLAISVVAPAGDPVTYDWSSDCPDATFATPHAATTAWSKPSAGSCTIHIVATSNGFSVTQSFVIVVFPAGTSDGAVSISGVFVTEPVIRFELADLGCTVGVMSGNGNASCSATIASPASTAFRLSVLSWGLSTPGTLDVSTNCGGLLGTTDRNPDLLGGPWVPPVAGGLCIFTAHATNGDGQTTTLEAAVLTRAGAALPAAQPPDLSTQIDTPTSGCGPGGDRPAQCGTIPAGTPVLIQGIVFWRDGLAGDVTVTDSCAGAQTVNWIFGTFNSSTWIVPSMPGAMCTSTVVATNLEGGTTQRQIQYAIGTP